VVGRRLTYDTLWLCRIMYFRQATRTSCRCEEHITKNQQRRKLIRGASVNRSTVPRNVANWKHSACGREPLIQNSVVRSRHQGKSSD
jgi:hypothetical protein